MYHCIIFVLFIINYCHHISFIFRALVTPGIVFLQRRNDLRRILSVEANRKVPVYATKDAGEATKARGQAMEPLGKTATGSCGMLFGQ